MRSAWIVVRMAATCALAAGCSGDADGPVALGTLERDRVELTAEAHEPIVALNVQEGERVSADQVLLQLDSASLTKELASARANASSARHRLLELTRGPRMEEILEARARLEGAESDVDAETREYERLQGLVEQRLVSQSELDRQRASRDRATAERKRAQAQLALLLKGTRIEELDQARDALSQAQSALERLEISVARLTVRAPRPGVIEALPYEVGERPAAGAVVAVLQADGATYARVYVPAQLRTALRPGAAAHVSVEGIEEPLAGRVRYVSSEAAFTPYYALTQEDRGRLSYLAEVTLTDEQAAARLPVGIPVEVTPDAQRATETASR
ncbi:MAG TPA: HlyD family efflux transporter periplasmic adaptor subunit [Burkholderiales bacterium]|nr:HlyD family efflux transporter periplasmic adaptor subunit [Burkholderiales bacterium]